jgi:Protein of unknown function (DUF3379)
VNCQEARILIGAEPCASSPELAAHLAACHACTDFQLEMVALEANIRRALEQAPVRIRARPRLPVQPRWLVAASLLLAFLATLGVWAFRSEDTLAHEVVAHVIAEPQSWTGMDAVPEFELTDVLRKSGVILAATPYSVVYARSCWFRGHYVPHMVVRTAHSLATVLILRNESVGTRQSFHEDGLSGVIVPSTHGSIAVLAASGAQLDELAERMRLAVHPSNTAR